MGVVVPLEEGKRKAGASIAPLVRLTADAMKRVNEIILERAGSDVSMIPEVARHLIDSGGKRLRPMLTIAGAEMCGYAGSGHIRLAASVEFMHTATLLHDDVVDESDMRRGTPAARKVWGNQASVLAVIKAKTAALFSAAAEVGPAIGVRDRAERAAFRSYGTNLGLAFQLIDDALDYGGNSAELGKKVGDDFREGKITLPVVLSFRRGSEADRDFWRRVLVEGAIGEGDLDHAIRLMRQHHAIEDTIERARHYGAVARDALAPFPDSAYRSALLEAVDFCIGRAY